MLDNRPNTIIRGRPVTQLNQQKTGPYLHTSSSMPNIKNVQTVVKLQPQDTLPPLVPSVVAKTVPPNQSLTQTLTTASPTKTESPISILEGKFAGTTLIRSNIPERPSSIDTLYNELKLNTHPTMLMYANLDFHKENKNVQSEITKISNENKTVTYFSSEMIKNVFKKLGFTYTPMPKERWTITTPTATITLDFLQDKTASITLDTSIFDINTTSETKKAITFQSQDAQPLQLIPPVIFALPIPDRKKLTFQNKNTILMIPSKTLERIITEFLSKFLIKKKMPKKNTNPLNVKNTPEWVNQFRKSQEKAEKKQRIDMFKNVLPEENKPKDLSSKVPYKKEEL